MDIEFAVVVAIAIGYGLLNTALLAYWSKLGVINKKNNNHWED